MIEGPFSVQYEQGDGGVMASLFGSPSPDHYSVVDTDGLTVAMFLAPEPANDMAYKYNRMYLQAQYPLWHPDAE